MKVFLSHSLIDKKLALYVKELIENVSLGVAEVWLSSALDGLRPGDNMLDEIHQNLSNSDKIIALLTPNSLQRPWILYESGFVAGNKKAEVIPLVFCINKNDLPLPLSAFVIYKGDDIEDINRLIMQIVIITVPKPNKSLIDENINNFIENIKEINESLNKTLKKPLEESLKFIDKLRASEIFHSKLSDDTIRKIQIISYTNEVESGSINKYHVKGDKEIEIFKRSVLSDLVEEQKANLERIISGSNCTFWNKSKKNINSTLTVEEEFFDSKTVKVNHYFFDTPPNKRAYIFDENQALVSYFETQNNIINCNSSIYKGMGESKSLWITNDTTLGAYMLDELREYINS